MSDLVEEHRATMVRIGRMAARLREYTADRCWVIGGLTPRAMEDARELERYVTWRDSITADMLLEASRSAYSGRLTIWQCPSDGILCPFGTCTDGTRSPCPHCNGKPLRIDYCTGQYFPTEYRRAACAVLASAIWAAMRADMPAPREPKLTRTHGPFTSEHDNIEGKTPGDWLRSKARQEFGRGIAARWFN